MRPHPGGERVRRRRRPRGHQRARGRRRGRDDRPAQRRVRGAGARSSPSIPNRDLAVLARRRPRPARARPRDTIEEGGVGAVFGHPRRRAAPRGPLLGRRRSPATGTDIYDRAQTDREVLILAAEPAARRLRRGARSTRTARSWAWSSPSRPTAPASPTPSPWRSSKPSCAGDLTPARRHRPLPRPTCARRPAHCGAERSDARSSVSEAEGGDGDDEGERADEVDGAADHRDAVGVGVDAEPDGGDRAVVGDHEHDDHRGSAAEQRRGDQLAEAGRLLAEQARDEVGAGAVERRTPAR